MKRGIKKPAEFIPGAHYSAVMSLSKAALADIAWGLAGAVSGEADDRSAVFRAFAREARVMLLHRGDRLPDALQSEDRQSEPDSGRTT